MIFYTGEYITILCLFLVFVLFGEFYWTNKISFRCLLLVVYLLCTLVAAMPIDRHMGFLLIAGIFFTLFLVFKYKGKCSFQDRYAAYLKLEKEETTIVKKYKSIYDFHLKKLQSTAYTSQTELLCQAVKAAQHALETKEAEDHEVSFQDVPNTFDILIHDLSLSYYYKEHITLYLRTVPLDALIEMVRFQLKDKVPLSFQINLDKEMLLPEKIVCDFEKLSQLIAYTIENRAIEAAVPISSIIVGFKRAQIIFNINEYQNNDTPIATPTRFHALAVTCDIASDSDQPEVGRRYNGSKPPQRFQSPEAASNSPKEAEIQCLANVQCGCFVHPSVVVVPCDLEQIQLRMIKDLEDQLDDITKGSDELDEDLPGPVEAFHAALHLYTLDPETNASRMVALLKQFYGDQKHPSGRFRYLRILGIAHSVAKVFPNTPIVLYCVLFHDLIHHTPVSLAFLRANYGLHLLLLVERMAALDKKNGLEADTVKMGNRAQQLFLPQEGDLLLIALLERLYDLKTFAAYTDKAFLENMARETLALDVPILTKHIPAIRSVLDTHATFIVKKLAKQLETTANQALEFVKKM